MDFETKIVLAIVITYAVLMGIEARFPGASYPSKPLWRTRGWGFLVLNACVSVLLPFIVPLEWLASHRVVEGSWIPTLPGALLGYVVLSFLAYWWHRASHRLPWLWRWFHQMHHAPERVDLGGATIFHPFETAVYLLLTFVATTMVLGLSPEAASLTAFIAQIYGFVVHLNVRTPRGMGYLIQRPEAHVLHHQREVTELNYGDFPLWDIIFGTFENPASFSSAPMGFGDGADERYGAMLMGREISG